MPLGITCMNPAYTCTLHATNHHQLPPMRHRHLLTTHCMRIPAINRPALLALALPVLHCASRGTLVLLYK